MRIGIDARFWSESGVGRYIRNLVFNLASLDQENTYYLFLLRKNLGQKLPKNFVEVEAEIPWYGVKEQVSFPKLLNKYNLDLMHFPHFNVPVFYSGKFVVTIHDLIHQHFQMRRASTHDPLIYKLKQFGYNKIFKNAVTKSQKILVPSEFVRDQLIKDWKISKDKIVVTYEGVEEEFLNIIKKTDSKKGLEKFDIKPSYIFYVGNAHPHKNVEGLIKAFLQLRKNYQYLQLVLAGHDHYFWERVKKEFGDSRVRGNDASSLLLRNDNIIFTGFVSDEELASLYKNAKCFVMPSFEEGFGIPILEAMAAGTAVVSSNAGSLKEIGGDAALYFDPSDSLEMQEKISQVLNNEKVRIGLVEKGEKRVKSFSFKKLAEETFKVYKAV